MPGLPPEQLGIPPRQVDRRWLRLVSDWLPILLVVVIVCIMAAYTYQQYLTTSRARWDGSVHDRHGHYAYGLKMALALRQGDVGGFLAEMEKGKVWPPFHGVLVAVVLSLGRLHHDWAVLPSLLGWIMTVLFGFLLACSVQPSRRAGLAAGAVACVFIAASPAYRAFATDVMLESLGAGLTLLALYCHSLAVQNKNSPWPWRWLGLALTVLFLEKYNYWLLVVLALCVAHFSVHPRQYLRTVVSAARGFDWRRWGREQARHPLTYLFLGIVVLVAFLFAKGPTSVQVAGNRVSLYPPNNLVTVGYAIALLRLILAARRPHSTWIARLTAPARQLLWWHVLPVGLSFLLPQRLSAFLWYLGPTNYGDAPVRDPIHAGAFYLATLSEDYHAGVWSVVLVLGLLSAAAFFSRNMGPDGRAVLFVVLIGAVLVILHPNQKSRFLHSWVAVAWVAAGIGFACSLRSRILNGLPGLRVVFALGFVAILSWGHYADWFAPGHSPEVGHRNSTASLLDLTDTYLPYVADSQRLTFFTTVPAGSVLQWTYLERYHRRNAVEVVQWGAGATAVQLRDRFRAWLASTQSDTIIFVDIPPGSYFFADVGQETYGGLEELLAEQTVFRQSHRWDLARYGCRITLWRRG